MLGGLFRAVELLVNLLCATPVLIWNQQHHWVTVSHVASNASANKAWQPSWSHLGDFATFLGVESLLLNPIFFIAAIWASIAFWKRARHDPRLVYLFSMGAPVFLAYLLFSFHSNVLPNWIAPSVLPLLCVMVIYWDTRWRLGVHALKGWLIAGLGIGCIAVGLLHEMDLVQKVTGKFLPPKIDPMTRVRGYKDMARVVDSAREKLLMEGKPVFVIGAHYGTTGLLSFYMPEARTNVTDNPVVYFLTSTNAANQFYFWPGYKEGRPGQNAIYVKELAMPSLVKDWPWKWLAGETNLFRYDPAPKPAPDILLQEFDSVSDLGLYDVQYRGRAFHIVQLFECRNLH